MRTISDEEIRSLKGATDTAYKLGGGVTQFPHLTRVLVPALSKYSSFNEENHDYVIPADIAVEADRRAGSPIIISAMAKLLGYQLVPDTSVGAPASPALRIDDAHRVLRETMDVSQAILDAAADGNFDQLDRKRIAREAREAMRALEQVATAAERGLPCAK